MRFLSICIVTHGSKLESNNIDLYKQRSSYFTAIVMMRPLL